MDNLMSSNTHPIFKFRQLNSMSQTELGDHLNVTQASISEWENGKKSPRNKTLQQLQKLDPVYFNFETIASLVTSGAGGK